ncbi:MAG: SCO family protein [Chloroflexi bacterium]|nr:SCO family protein [Chloroflexota bacterium]
MAWYEYTYHTLSGATVEPTERAPDFVLTDQTGEAFALSELEGQWILLNYGYTSCPDVCPATLAVLGRVQSYLKRMPNRCNGFCDSGPRPGHASQNGGIRQPLWAGNHCPDRHSR